MNNMSRVVRDHLFNDRGAYRSCKLVAELAYIFAEDRYAVSKRSQAASELADALQMTITIFSMPEMLTEDTLYQSLLDAALAEVDWYKIGLALVDSFEITKPIRRMPPLADIIAHIEHHLRDGVHAVDIEADILKGMADVAVGYTAMEASDAAFAIVSRVQDRLRGSIGPCYSGAISAWEAVKSLFEEVGYDEDT